MRAIETFSQTSYEKARKNSQPEVPLRNSEKQNKNHFIEILIDCYIVHLCFYLLIQYKI